MNARQRRKARRAGTHYDCDNCRAFQRRPIRLLTGCPRCWRASQHHQRRQIAHQREHGPFREAFQEATA